MRVDNLRWHPIRLGMARVGPNRWRISRGGAVVGELRRGDEGWESMQAKERVDDGQRAVSLDGFGRARHPSFVAAALRVARLSGIWASSDGPQDFGQVRMLRINVATRWYTVVVDGRGDRYVYEDFTIDDDLSDQEQAVLRRVLVEADRHLGRESR